MEPRIILFVILGAAIGAIYWLEKRLEGTFLSVPIIYVGLGWGLFSLPLNLGWLTPAFDYEQTVSIEYISELIVIVSLVSLGLSIDRPFSWKGWKQILPLLLVTMPLSIAAMAWLGWWAMGLSLPSAILLGACLSPTDPVLARAVQVGPPGQDERDDVRFNLSAEAGFNDSLAFPFVFLAMALTGSDGEWFGKWLGVHVFWKILAGVGVGWLVGRAGGWVAFRESADKKDKDHLIADGAEGLLVIGSLMLAYGLGEMAHGYGFLSVFVAAVTAKQRESKSELHKKSYAFIDQVERIILVIILIGFGCLLASGVLNSLTWSAVGLSVAFLLLIRPLAGMVALCGSSLPKAGKLAVAFLGIRGIGSFYYLAYGQHHANFTQMPELWSAISFTVLLSVVLHGLSASKFLAGLSKKDRLMPEHDEPSSPTLQ